MEHLRGAGPLVPAGPGGQVAALLAAAGQPGPGASRAAEALAESITDLCRAEGLLP